MFLKASDEPTSQLNPDRDKILTFPEFFLSSVLQFAPALWCVDGNVEHPNDYERATILKRKTQLSFENDVLKLRRQRSNSWKAHLVEMGNN